jgi:hypothetical protein
MININNILNNENQGAKDNNKGRKSIDSILIDMALNSGTKYSFKSGFNIKEKFCAYL